MLIEELLKRIMNNPQNCHGKGAKKRSLDSVNYPSFYLPAFTVVFANSLS
jgi:hypothetical protein